VTLATLAIHAESWLQEELAAQTAVLAALERIDAAARASSTPELESAAQALAACLPTAAAREARRRALLGRFAAELALGPNETNLARVADGLARAGLDVTRLAALRAELRALVARVLKASRRLAALASYHRGLLEDLCAALVGATPSAANALVDTRA
jgi:hypothetical protein